MKGLCRADKAPSASAKLLKVDVLRLSTLPICRSDFQGNANSPMKCWVGNHQSQPSFIELKKLFGGIKWSAGFKIFHFPDGMLEILIA